MSTGSTHAPTPQLPDAVASFIWASAAPQAPSGCCEGLLVGGGTNAAATAAAAGPAAVVAAAVTWEPL